jgi:hypothetical protein
VTIGADHTFAYPGCGTVHITEDALLGAVPEGAVALGRVDGCATGGTATVDGDTLHLAFSYSAQGFAVREDPGDVRPPAGLLVEPLLGVVAPNRFRCSLGTPTKASISSRASQSSPAAFGKRRSTVETPWTRR